MHNRYWDPRITLVDINHDGTQDLILSGYQKQERRDAQKQVICDSVVALDGRRHTLLWGFQTGGHVQGFPPAFRTRANLGSAGS